MTNRPSFSDLCRRLSSAYDEGEARAVVRLLLEEAFGLSLTDMLCGGVESLSPADAERLDAMMLRLAAMEPVQYVVGHEWFCGRRFRVTPAVLIPRPETQQLVSLATAAMDGKEDHSDVLDIGTGSGCIAVSIAAACPGARVEAWDLSGDALDVARENARENGVSVRYSRQDALHAPCDADRWDVVVSNPPYIPERERQQMSLNVTGHEPGMALFVPDGDPLVFYRAIARYAAKALRPGGTLLFETHTRLAGDVAALVLQEGLSGAEVLDDIFDRPRFVRCRRACP